MTPFPGLITKTSPHSVRETLDRLENVLKTKGIKVFARIDQAAEAQAVGMTMPPMELLIFGNPKGGTPVMLAVPEAGIDLPLKAIAWQASDGTVHMNFNDPGYLQSRFNLTAETVRPLASIVSLIDAAIAP